MTGQPAKGSYKEFFLKMGHGFRPKNLVGGGRGELPPAAPEYLPEGFIRMDPGETDMLWLFARRAKVGIVEIGRFNGGSTFIIASANVRVPIWSIDIAPKDDKKLKKQIFGKHRVGENVTLITGDANKVGYQGKFDLLFIDGDHSYDAVTADINTWFPRLEPGGYMLFHDCYLGQNGIEVQDAVLDFIARTPCQIIIPPTNALEHWRGSTGSMACLRKL